MKQAMDRRAFLITMAAVAAVAVLPTQPAQAVQTPIEPPINKYKEAIRLFDRAVAVSYNAVECNSRFDELCRFLKENWDRPARNSEVMLAAKQFLRTTPVDIAGIRGIPPNVADEIYPIALFKLGLKSYNLPLDSGKMKMFTWFHNEYGWLVIQSLS